MKENRKRLIALLTAAVLISVVLIATLMIFIKNGTLGAEESLDSNPVSTTIAQEDTVTETTTDAYVYEGTALPSDWYADIPNDPTATDKIYFSTFEEYIAVSQAARVGDMEALSACWKSSPWNHDFKRDESFLEFMRCIFGRTDSVPLVWPDGEWELVRILIETEIDRFSIFYRNSTDPDKEVRVLVYLDGMNELSYYEGNLSIVRDYLRDITVDGYLFSIHLSRIFEFSMQAIRADGSDIVSFLFNDNVSDETFHTWQYGTIYEYAGK